MSLGGFHSAVVDEARSAKLVRLTRGHILLSLVKIGRIHAESMKEGALFTFGDNRRGRLHMLGTQTVQTVLAVSGCQCVTGQCGQGSLATLPKPTALPLSGRGRTQTVLMAQVSGARCLNQGCVGVSCGGVPCSPVSECDPDTGTDKSLHVNRS